MRVTFSAVLALALVLLVTFVSAAPVQAPGKNLTNAERFKRNLGPAPPKSYQARYVNGVKRFIPDAAIAKPKEKRASPSAKAPATPTKTAKGNQPHHPPLPTIPNLPFHISIPPLPNQSQVDAYISSEKKKIEEHLPTGLPHF